MKITARNEYVALLFVVAMLPVVQAADAALPAARLSSEIAYRYVGHLEQTDDSGRLLVWEATIRGT